MDNWSDEVADVLRKARDDRAERFAPAHPHDLAVALFATGSRGTVEEVLAEFAQRIATLED
jgi:hypothetical protein